RGEHQQEQLEVAERGRAVDPPDVVGDDAVEQQQHADGELGEEPPAADLEQLLRVAQLGPRPGQVVVARVVAHRASAGAWGAPYNTSRNQVPPTGPGPAPAPGSRPTKDPPAML